jgi:two-component sensor histidine kinase
VFLRLTRTDEERFKALSFKVEQLNTEIRERRRAQAILQETLRERELLLRELQHRVKNNMHMLAGLLAGAAREASSAEAKAALNETSLRFAAVSAVQQLLYSSDKLETIDSEALASTLFAAVVGISAAPVDPDMQVDPFDLPIQAAVPVALILNELLTNAVKHGKPAGARQALSLRLSLNSEKLSIEVRDNGPGFDLGVDKKRSSGIGLVRGLLRQLGGALEVRREDGACCIATIPARWAGAAKSAPVA